MKKINRGFTLIELLIVIALLGALAVGLLAAVDPFEQLKKGRDTSTRNTAAEFQGALIRFYASRGTFPTSIAIPTTNTLNNLAGAVTELQQAGELKTDFLLLAGTGNVTRININIPTSERAVVCLNPESKSFRNDQYTKYDSTGNEKVGCPNATATDCYVCFQ